MKLYGIAEIAAEIGERRQTVAQWHRRGKLPPPTAELSMGPVWTHEALSEWLTNVQEGTTMTRWTTLELVDGDGSDLTGGRRIAALREYRATSAINGVFFARTGLPHEREDDASTWGPQSPAHVDWTGFSQTQEGPNMTRSYDQGFIAATERLLADLQAAGHQVETPVTGSVIINGVEVKPAEWDKLAVNYGGDLEETLAALAELEEADTEPDDED